MTRSITVMRPPLPGRCLFASPVLTWTGSLAVGAAVTVTFSVTVNAADTGDKVLATAVSTAAAGSNRPAGGTDARCSSSVPVLIPGLDLTVTAGTASAAPGSVVSYTVVADNTGQTADTGVSFTASLAGVLDDASYDGERGGHRGRGVVLPARCCPGPGRWRGGFGDGHVLGDGE